MTLTELRRCKMSGHHEAGWHYLSSEDAVIIPLGADQEPTPEDGWNMLPTKRLRHNRRDRFRKLKVAGLTALAVLACIGPASDAQAAPVPPSPILHYGKCIPVGHKPKADKPKPKPKLTGMALYRSLCVQEAARQRALGLRVWNPDDCVTCMRRESGGRPWADENPPYIGLFQLDRAFGKGVWNLYDPEVNVHIAADLYGRLGWQPWSAMN